MCLICGWVYDEEQGWPERAGGGASGPASQESGNAQKDSLRAVFYADLGAT